MKPKLFERNRARELRNQGFSIKEIVKMLPVSKGSISAWVKDINLSPSQLKRLKEKERQAGRDTALIRQEYWKNYRLDHPRPIKIPKQIRYVETFFDTWSSDMAYILGYFAADGHMFINKNGSCYVCFTSTDLELIKIVKRILQIENKIEIRQSKGNAKDAYILQIGGKIIYQKFINLGFTPKKSLTIQFPDIPKNVLRDFIRGYFDGDGCAFTGLYRRRNRRNSFVRSLNIRFSSGSFKFLKGLQSSLIEVLKLGKGSLHSNGPNYELSYSYQNVIKLFSFLYWRENIPYLQRKHNKLFNGINNWDRSSTVEQFLVKE